MIDVATARCELIRALGAVADSPPAAHTAAGALGLQSLTDAELTDVFVLNLPPYAAVYLGPDGALGGEGADRVAGFWRVLRIEPPTEPDHLSALLGLYASLGQAVADTHRPATRAALRRTQATLFWEHLHSWLPGYLEAVPDLPAPALCTWAVLLRRALAAEADCQPAMPALPLALRAAPPGLDTGQEEGLREMTDALTIPVRTGMILTRHRLALGARQAGVGHRIGERRFTLQAMIEQDPPGTLAWLAAEAFRWQRRHEARGTTDATTQWWADRALRTGQVLQGLIAQAEQLVTPRIDGSPVDAGSTA
jgi:TorA maturation chaperone TorD